MQYEFKEIKAAIDLDKNAANIGWIALFKSPGKRRRIRIIFALAFFSQWSGTGLVYVISICFSTYGRHKLMSYLL